MVLSGPLGVAPATLASLIALTAATASAQEPAAPAPVSPVSPVSDDRTGVVLGAGLGPASFSVTVGDRAPDDFRSAFAWQLRFGGMLSPRLALGAELFALSSDSTSSTEGLVTAYQRNLGVWLRYWFVRRFWAHLGLNTARLGIHSDRASDHTYSGLGSSFGLGFAPLVTRSWSVDLALCVSGAHYGVDEAGLGVNSESVAFTASYNWFF